MHPIGIDRLSAEQQAELDHANRTARDGRLRIRALIVLLAAERGTLPAQDYLPVDPVLRSAGGASW
jgi:hypothetical protein